jgi:hypothetical protein
MAMTGLRQLLHGEIDPYNMCVDGRQDPYISGPGYRVSVLCVNVARYAKSLYGRCDTILQFNSGGRW